MSNKIAELNKAIQLDPENAQAYKDRGNAYYGAKKYDEALADWNKAVELDENFHQAINNRGMIYRERGQVDEALKNLNRAIEIDPGFINAYFNRAGLYRDIKDYDKSIQDYTKCLELNPEYDSASAWRLDIFIDKGFYEQSVKDFLDSKSHEENPKVQLPEVLINSPYKFDRQAAINAWVKTAKDKIPASDIPENLLQAFSVFYYWTQIYNGGISQFVYNSNWDSNIVNAVKNGLHNMNADLNFDLFNKVIEYINGLGLKFQEKMEEDYPEYADNMEYLSTLTDEFYDIEDEESLEKLNYEYIGTFDNLDLL